MSSMDRPYVTLVLTGLLLGAPSLAFAQNNTLIIEQDSLGGTSGNTITVDQSAASGGTLGGLSLLPQRVRNAAEEIFPTGNPTAALQIGSGNTAEIVDAGQGSEVVLLQQSPTGGAGNSAGVNIQGSDGFAAILQDGQNNTATVNLDGTLNSGSAIQFGNENTATVNVDGNGALGVATQIGSNNNMTLDVTGTTGTAVYYTQSGSGLGGTSVDGGLTGTGANNPSVITNGATVIITQTNF